MYEHILTQMNATLQPCDEPYTIEDAAQHVRDYNAWVDSQVERSSRTPDPIGVEPIEIPSIADSHTPIDRSVPQPHPPQLDLFDKP